MEVIHVQNDSLALLTKAEIDMQIATAKAFPRSIKNFLDKALSIATISESVAESCGYALSRGGKTITGPSVRLAEIVASSYGNVRYGGRVIMNDGEKITAQGICHDLESNTSVTIEVSRSILQHEYKNGQKTGRMVPMNVDMQVIIGNAATAIAIRNAVFKVIPAALVDSIYEETKNLVAGTIETLPARRAKAISVLKDMGVKESQICEVLDIKRIEDIDLEKLSVLRGMVAAIKNGEATIKEMFEPEPPAAEKKITPEFKRAKEMLEDINTALDLRNFLTKVATEKFTTDEAVQWTTLVLEKEKAVK